MPRAVSPDRSREFARRTLSISSRTRVKLCPRARWDEARRRTCDGSFVARGPDRGSTHRAEWSRKRDAMRSWLEVCSRTTRFSTPMFPWLLKRTRLADQPRRGQRSSSRALGLPDEHLGECVRCVFDVELRCARPDAWRGSRAKTHRVRVVRRSRDDCAPARSLVLPKQEARRAPGRQVGPRHEVVAIVVGVARNLDDSDSASTRWAHAFVKPFVPRCQMSRSSSAMKHA